MSKQLKVRDNMDNMQMEQYKQTVCVVRTPEGRAAEKRRGKKEDLPAYIIFSILSILCSAGTIYLIEMIMKLKLLILIPAGFALIFAVAAKVKRTGVMSIMALVFSIIAVFVACTVSVACVCVNQFMDEARTEYVEPFAEDLKETVQEKLPWFFD